MQFALQLPRRPQAAASVRGSREYPNVRGTVRFYQTPCGVLVAAEIQGLPQTEQPCRGGIFAFHIHSGTACCGDENDPFAQALGHYNPKNCEHPYHAGDMPPLFGSGGQAFLAFLTDRFSIQEVLGRTVIIHQRPDDFSTQPSGNAGKKIA